MPRGGRGRGRGRGWHSYGRYWGGRRPFRTFQPTIYYNDLIPYPVPTIINDEPEDRIIVIKKEDSCSIL